jgi:chromosome segregation ATPase
MNKYRRRELRDIVNDLEKLKERLDFLKEAESEYIDGIPDSMEAKREAAEEGLSALEEAIDAVDEVVEQINKAIGDE